MSIAIIWLGLAVGIAAVTVTRSKLTRAIRGKLLSKNVPFFGELLSCPYCLAHWLALIAAAGLPNSTWPFFVVEWLTITGVAAIFMGVIMRLWLFQEKEIENLRELLRDLHELRIREGNPQIRP